MRSDNNKIAPIKQLLEEQSNLFLTTAHSSLIFLFWNLGKEINKRLSDFQHREEKAEALHKLSEHLFDRYGPYFILENIMKMKRLANQYPEMTDVIALDALDWEQISSLLPVENQEERKYYTLLALKNGLRANALQERINENEYHTNKRVLEETKATDSFIRKLMDERPKRINHFKEPLLSFFRPLLERREASQTANERRKPIPGKDSQLFDAVNLLVSDYQNWLNGWFNSHLNLLFWNIGKEINNQIKYKQNDVEVQATISGLIAHLSLKDSGYFNQKNLSYMAQFALQIPDSNIAHYLASLVEWDFIVALLSIADQETKLFYARRSAEEGWSIEQLKTSIRENIHQKANGEKESEKDQIKAIKNPIVKTTQQLRTEYKYSSDEEISRKLMGHVRQNHLDIFHNRHFVSFVTT